MVLKKTVFQKFENMWSKHTMLLTEKYNIYKKMGVIYSLDSIRYVTRQVKDEIIQHLFDRQILRYIEQKYTALEKNLDKNLAIKANQLCPAPKKKLCPDLVKSKRNQAEKDQKEQFGLAAKTFQLKNLNLSQTKKKSKFLNKDNRSYFDNQQLNSKKKDGNYKGIFMDILKDSQGQSERRSSYEIRSKRQIDSALDVPQEVHEHEKDFERRQFERDSRREIILSHLPESIRTIKSVRMQYSNKTEYVFNPTKMWEKNEASHYAGFYRKLLEKLPEVKMKEDAYLEQREKRNRTSSIKKKRHNTTSNSFRKESSMRSHSTSKRKFEKSSSKKLDTVNFVSAWENSKNMSNSGFDFTTNVANGNGVDKELKEKEVLENLLPNIKIQEGFTLD